MHLATPPFPSQPPYIYIYNKTNTHAFSTWAESFYHKKMFQWPNTCIKRVIRSYSSFNLQLMLCERLPHRHAHAVEITPVLTLTTIRCLYMRHERFSVINLCTITCNWEIPNTLLFQDELVTVTEYKNVPQLSMDFFMCIFVPFLQTLKSFGSS
jgi:hypothetical protein